MTCSFFSGVCLMAGMPSSRGGVWMAVPQCIFLSSPLRSVDVTFPPLHPGLCTDSLLVQCFQNLVSPTNCERVPDTSPFQVIFREAM